MTNVINTSKTNIDKTTIQSGLKLDIVAVIGSIITLLFNLFF